MDERKKLALTCCASGLGVALALYASYGNPPYGFFGPFRCVCGLIAVFLCWSLFKEAVWSVILTGPTLYVAFVLLTGKMHREQWKPWDESAVVLFAFCGVLAVGLGIRRRHND